MNTYVIRSEKSGLSFEQDAEFVDFGEHGVSFYVSIESQSPDLFITYNALDSIFKRE